MAVRKTGLGRGLDALIPADRPSAGFTTLAVDLISPNPQQPREHFDEEALESLVASIREVGVLQRATDHRPEEIHSEGNRADPRGSEPAGEEDAGSEDGRTEVDGGDRQSSPAEL